MPSLEEYTAACKIVDDWILDPDSDWNELKITPEVQLLGILKTLRFMLRAESGQSILDRCATVMRRHDQMYAALGHYGSKLQIESSEGRVVVKSEPHPDFLDFPGPQHG